MVSNWLLIFLISQSSPIHWPKSIETQWQNRTS